MLYAFKTEFPIVLLYNRVLQWKYDESIATIVLDIERSLRQLMYV